MQRVRETGIKESLKAGPAPWAHDECKSRPHLGLAMTSVEGSLTPWIQGLSTAQPAGCRLALAGDISAVGWDNRPVGRRNRTPCPAGAPHLHFAWSLAN